MTPAQLASLKEEVIKTIQTTVNGKVDRMQDCMNAHNVKHEEDMKRVLPVIEAFEEGQRDLNTAKKGGKAVLWLSGTVTAIGGAYLVLRAIFWN